MACYTGGRADQKQNLCSMFAATAVNNIMAVTGGIEHYFDAADLSDVTVMALNSGEKDLGEKIGELTSVEEIRTGHFCL